MGGKWGKGGGGKGEGGELRRKGKGSWWGNGIRVGWEKEKV